MDVVQITRPLGADFELRQAKKHAVTPVAQNVPAQPAPKPIVPTPPKPKVIGQDGCLRYLGKDVVCTMVGGAFAYTGLLREVHQFSILLRRSDTNNSVVLFKHSIMAMEEVGVVQNA
jgi:sRNA-binding regulator protein Hfq